MSQERKKCGRPVGYSPPPETREKLRAAMLKLWGRGYYGKRVRTPVPPHLSAYAAKLRTAGIVGERFNKAIEEAQCTE